MSSMPDSQCARALAYNRVSGNVAVGHNDGTLTIRESPAKLDKVIATKNDSSEWIETI